MRRAPDKTGNVNNSSAAVMISPHGNRGIIFNEIPKDLRKKIVTQKLRVVNQEDIPDINNPCIILPVLAGDTLIKEVLKGGYNVHPVPPPKSQMTERTIV
jgi:hypothetical protein